jgi:hypothetical protein
VAVGLRGVLRDFGIAEVFQLIGQQRKTGVLEIEHQDRRVALTFDSGAVVCASTIGEHPDEALGEMLVRCGLLTRERLEDLTRARKKTLRPLRTLLVERGSASAAQIEEIEDLLTRETLFDVLRWTDGAFRFTAKAVSHGRESTKLIPAEQILMDGLRMADEWRTFAGEVSEDFVFQRSGRFESYRESAQDPRGRVEDAERLFRLIDGRLSARRVIDLSRLGTFEGTRILAELRRVGLIERLDPRKLPKNERGPSAPLHARVGVRSWIAAAVPLTLLGLLAIASLSRLSSHLGAAAQPGFAIRRAPLSVARVTFETERIRRALEAYRFANGGYPEALADLVDAGLVESGALTPQNGHPYYYARNGEEAVLLAPEY